MRSIPVSDGAHATRVSLGLVIPGIVLILFNRPDLIVYAAFGSFTGMYGRADARALRLLHQSQGAVLLLAGTAAGITLAQEQATPAIVTLSAAVFAIGGSMLADFFALRPEGPFYGIFALGAIAGVPPNLVAPWVSWAIAAGSALLAIVIGLVSHNTGTAEFGSLAEAFRKQRARARPAAMLHAVRYAIAVVAAGIVALSLGLSHVNWAIAGAAVTLAAADPRGRLWRGVHRILGTMAGLAVTALVLLPGLGPRTLAIIVIALLFPTELFMAVNYTLALSFFTPMIMLMTELAKPIGTRDLLTTRALGTMVGVLVGIVVSYLVRDWSRWSAEREDSKA